MAVRVYFEPPQHGLLEAEIFQSGLRLEDLIVLCYKLLQVPTTSSMSGFHFYTNSRLFLLKRTNSIPREKDGGVSAVRCGYSVPWCRRGY